MLEGLPATSTLVLQADGCGHDAPPCGVPPEDANLFESIIETLIDRKVIGFDANRAAAVQSWIDGLTDPASVWGYLELQLLATVYRVDIHIGALVCDNVSETVFQM